MSKLIIGKNLETGEDFTIDPDRLLTTRVLAQANSGGGKSFLVRKIVEMMNGHAQQIILDIEDDFSSLREKHDFILAGSGGDISVDPRSAELFAHKILELRADVIINLYELKPHDRIRYVKLFFQAMIDAPKSLWHPALVVLDEAQIFAPEKEQAESAGAVADMASRGRKRGFCLLAATQRPARLDKDVAAECRNKLIGLANIQIDRKRAAEELGLTDRAEILALRDLDEGEFYAVGPAFPRGLNKIKIGAVKTTHHAAGEITQKHQRPLATSKVQKILAKLTDLPKEVEQDLNDKQWMRAKIKELEGELRKAKTSIQVKTETKIEKVVDKKVIEQEVRKFRSEFFKKFKEHAKWFQGMLETEFGSIEIESVNLKHLPTGFKTVPNSGAMFAPTPAKAATRVLLKNQTSIPNGVYSISGTDASKPMGRCERALLKFLAMRAGKTFTRTQVGVMTQYRAGAGAFNNAVGRLVSIGAIRRLSDGCLTLVDGFDARSILGEEYSAPEPNSLLEWMDKLGKAERTIFDVVSKDTQKPFSKDELGELTGYVPGTGGFNNALGRLNTLGLIQRNNDGSIQMNQEVLGL